MNKIYQFFIILSAAILLPFAAQASLDTKHTAEQSLRGEVIAPSASTVSATATGIAFSPAASSNNHAELVSTLNYILLPKLWNKVFEYGRDWNPQPIRAYTGHNDSVTCLALMGKGNFVSGSHDRTLKLWHLDSDKAIRTYEGHDRGIHCVSMLDKKHFISSAGSEVRAWHIENTQYGQICHSHGDGILAKLNSEHFIACSQKVPAIYRLENDGSISLLRDKAFEYERYILCCTVVDRGHFIIGLIGNNCLKLLSISQATCVRTLEGHDKPVCCVTTLDEQHVLSGSYDNTIKLWYVGPNKAWFSIGDSSIRTFRGHNDCISCIAVINKDCFASGSRDNSIKLWHIPSGTLMRTLNGHNSDVLSLAVIDDNQFISSSKDKTIKLWGCNKPSECELLMQAHILNNVKSKPDAHAATTASYRIKAPEAKTINESQVFIEKRTRKKQILSDLYDLIKRNEAMAGQDFDTALQLKLAVLIPELSDEEKKELTDITKEINLINSETTQVYWDAVTKLFFHVQELQKR